MSLHAFPNFHFNALILSHGVPSSKEQANQHSALQKNDHETGKHSC